MTIVKTLGLFIVSACVEITGCYLAYVWIRKAGPPWLPFLSLGCLGVFAFLLTLQSGAAGRTYATYGGAYVAISLAWLWLVEHQCPTHWDILGVGIMFVGISVILLGNQQ